ncbi:hypothetical protein HYV64_02455 [Candidatus Shapirobacteria bacterium]|nr:hypothetical protein [Candidatus Shapirobacteria bacterium]
MTFDVAVSEPNLMSVPEANEHVLTGVIHRMNSLVVSSFDNSKGIRDKRECLNFVSFYIDLVQNLSSLVQSDTPLTVDIIRTYVSIYAEKDMAEKVSGALFHQQSDDSPPTVQSRVLDNALNKVELKAKSLIIGMPFQADSNSKKQKCIRLASYVYEFVHEVKSVTAKGEPLEETYLFIGGYSGAKPPAMGMFLSGVLGKYTPVRLVDGDQTSLISRTHFPDLFLVHTLRNTSIATELSHSFCLVGINNLPARYDYQPEMRGFEK